MAALDAVSDGLTCARPGRRPGRRTRRVIVVGSSALRASVLDARSPDIALVALVPAEAADAVVTSGCDEVVVDAAGLEALRGRPRDRLGRQVEVVTVPDLDPQTVAACLRRPFGRWAPLKRALDVVVSFALLVVLLPVLALVGLAVRLDSPGGCLFSQERVGRGGRTFRFYKLRSMQVDGDDSAHRAYCAALVQGSAERHEGLFKLADDPRVTRVGRLLRRASLDELPQLWNVLRGDMSLVGPRPLLPSDAELFTAEHWGRLRVRPGITGAWQVAGRSQLSFHEMVQLDVGYWRAWTPLRDLQLLAATPRAVLTERQTA